MHGLCATNSAILLTAGKWVDGVKHNKPLRGSNCYTCSLHPYIMFLPNLSCITMYSYMYSLRVMNGNFVLAASYHIHADH